MNTANRDPGDAGFAEQWDDLQYSCSRCEQLARALAFIWSTIEGIPDNSQRRHGVSAAHFLACELDAHAGSLEFDLQTLKHGGARKPPSFNLIAVGADMAGTSETPTSNSIVVTCSKAVGLAESLMISKRPKISGAMQLSRDFGSRSFWLASST